MSVIRYNKQLTMPCQQPSTFESWVFFDDGILHSLTLYGIVSVIQH